MNISFFLIKNDLVNFLKKNVAKFIVAAILLVLTAVLAVRNAVTTDGIREYFEGKGSALYAFMRGDCSLFFFDVYRLYGVPNIIDNNIIMLLQRFYFIFVFRRYCLQSLHWYL